MNIYVFKKFYLFIFREGKGGRKRGRETSMWERNIDWLSLTCAPTGDRTYNPGLCPDRELNRQPFALWGDAQQTEPHWSGWKEIVFTDFVFLTWFPPVLLGKERNMFECKVCPASSSMCVTLSTLIEQRAEIVNRNLYNGTRKHSWFHGWKQSGH